MFDLFRSRAKATRYLLSGLLLLVALSMVTYLVPGSGMSGGPNDTIVAEIGKDTLLTRDVQTRIQSVMRERSIPADVAPMILPMVVNEMIADRALEYEANNNGITVNDSELAAGVRGLIPQLYQDGKFVGNAAYAEFLSRQNLTIEQFESLVRRQLTVTKFQNMALEGIIVTPKELENEYRAQNEKAKLDYILISADKFKSQVKVSADDVQSFFKSHRGSFRIPEARSAVLLVADQTKIEAGFTISDDQLRQVYSQERERFRVPERVHVRHILFKTMEKGKDEVPKIQSLAEDVLKKIRGGADFAELAKKYSDDPGSATKGGDLDWVTRGQTVKNFEDTAFSLKPKEISGVVKTEYGFHIIQVLEKDTPRMKPFDEVKSEIASERKRQLVVDRMQTSADQARAMLAANPGQAEQIAQKLGLEVARVDHYRPGGAMPLLGVSREAQDAISALGKGDVSQVIQPAQDKLAVIEVTGIEPAREAELNEVEAQVREAATATKAEDLVGAKVRAAQAALAGGGLQAAAKAAGVEIKTTEEFTRSGAAEGLGSPQLFPQAFAQPIGSTFGPVKVGPGTMIARVAARIEPDLSKLAATREQLIMGIRSRKAQLRKQLLDDGVMTLLREKGKLKVHQDVIDRIIAGFRS